MVLDLEQTTVSGGGELTGVLAPLRLELLE